MPETNERASVALPSCQQCGGPLSATDGQSIIWATDLVLDDGTGRVVKMEARSGWCGPCTADWDRRIGGSEGEGWRKGA